jgi:hypothetical protein
MPAPEMHATAIRRQEHLLEATARMDADTTTAPLQEALNDDLTRSAVERQRSIVREALRVAQLQDPSLRHSWPELHAAMARCDQLRDWEKPVEVQELGEFVEWELEGWQAMMAALIKQQQDEGVRLDQHIAENLRRLAYEF